MASALVLLSLALASSAVGQSSRSAISVGSAPTSLIGETGGEDPSRVFHDIRGALLMPDGTIVVADGGSLELRVFDRSGRLIARFGRKGGGPAEFASIEWIDSCGGPTVFLYDVLRFRITEWSTDGRLLDDFIVQGPRGDLPPYSVACGPGDTFVLVGWPDVTHFSGTGAYRPMVDLGIAEPNGRFRERLRRVPGGDRFRTDLNDGPVPLGRSTTIRASGTSILIGTADSFYIDMYASNGSHRAIGLDRRRDALTRRVRNAWIEERIKHLAPERQEAQRRRLRDAEFLPDSLPAYSSFHVDRLGLIWVQAYPIPGEPVGPWEVLSVFGDHVARVDLPPGFRPMDILADFIAGVAVDDLGVERVLVYKLTR